jgi:NADPH-dependent ferric siderophore reductase
MYGEVIRTETLTPSLVRVVLGGDGLTDFEPVPFTDAYVNVALPPAGASYAAPFDPAEVRERLAPEEWPLRRRYTVAAWDVATRELTLDFVVHGDAGAAGPWARDAEPGDLLVLTGPSGGYSPDPTADWHLMVGDESALPAIAASAAAVPAAVPLVVRLLCDGPEHEVPLATYAALDVRWLHRTGDEDDADLLAQAVRDLPFLRGRVHAFVHGEAGEIRDVRRHLLGEREVPREDVSVSAYWRRFMTDEAWRQVKRDFNAAMEADVA